MFQGEIKTGFLELPGPKFVTKIVANITKEHQRRARRTHTKGTLPKRSIKAASMDALSSQKENLDALAALPRTTVNPITERREQVIKKRAKVSKRNKKANTSLKKNAAAKIKAARLQRHKETRTAQKQDALDKALAKEWEERYRAEAAERAAFVAMKELEPAQKVTFVDSIYQVRDLVDEVMSLSNPALYLDAEGISLSRDGDMVFSRCILTLTQGRIPMSSTFGLLVLRQLFTPRAILRTQPLLCSSRIPRSRNSSGIAVWTQKRSTTNMVSR